MSFDVKCLLMAIVIVIAIPLICHVFLKLHGLEL